MQNGTVMTFYFLIELYNIQAFSFCTNQPVATMYIVKYSATKFLK